MKIYKLEISSDNGFQTIVDLPPDELLYKNLYRPYLFNYISSIRLDLDKGCEITDILNNGNLNFKGFTIKNKFVSILNNFNLIDIQFVEIIDEKIIDYSFMFFNSDISNKLNYDLCEFILVEDFLGVLDVLDENLYQNRDSLIELDKENAGSDNIIIPSNGYHFIDGFNIFDYDVFRIGQFNDCFYVSERVKNALEENNITGVDFIEEPLFNGKLDRTNL